MSFFMAVPIDILMIYSTYIDDKDASKLSIYNDILNKTKDAVDYSVLAVIDGEDIIGVGITSILEEDGEHKIILSKCLDENGLTDEQKVEMIKSRISQCMGTDMVIEIEEEDISEAEMELLDTMGYVSKESRYIRG